MKRVWKWTRRIAKTLVIAALIVVGLWVGLVPSVVERAITAQLEQVGVPRPKLAVRGVSLTHIEVTNLTSGEDRRVRIGAVGIDYSPLQLLRKRIDSIEVTGFEAEIRRKDGVWDFGPLADLHGPGGEASGEMPFRRIDLRASAILLDLDGRRLRIPFHGSMENVGQDALAVDLTVGFEGATARITGTVNPRTQDLKFTLNGEVPEPTALLATALPQAGPVTSRLGGGLGFKSVLVREKGEVNLSAALAGAGPGLGVRVGRHEVFAEAFTLTVIATLDKALGLTGLECKADARGLVADGFAIASTTATLRKDGGALALGASAEGTGWKLSRLEAREAGLEDWLRGRTDRARVQFRGDAAADKPWPLLGATAMKQWIDGQALGRAQFSAEAALELHSTPAGSQAGWTWSAVVPEARLTLAKCSLPLPGAAGKLEGLAGTLAFRADANPERVAAMVLPGSWVAIQAVEAKAGSETVRVGAARLTFAGHEEQPLLVATLQGAGLLAANGALVVEAAGPVTASVGDGTSVKLGAVRSVVEGRWSGEGGAFTSSLAIRGIEASLKREFGNTRVEASVPEAVLSLKARRDFPIGPGPESPLTLDFVVNTLPGGKGLSADATGTQVTVGSFEARGTVTVPGAATPVVNTRVSLADASVRHKEAGLALAGITADVPVAWNVTVPLKPGRFAVRSIDLRGAVLPELSGTLGVADTRADFTLAWEPLPGAKLHMEGSALTGAQGPSARAYVSLPLFRIKDEEALGRLVPQLKGALVGGSFALDGYVRVSSAGVTPTLALTVLDGTFKSKAWEAEAEGVHATVRLSRFEPVLTPRQELQIVLARHAKMGKLEVRDGFVAFRLEPKEAEGRPTGWTAYVQRGEWGWAGGRLYVEDLRFDPGAKEHAVTVHARDLKLGDLLALIPKQEATGVGSLDGQLPVTIGAWPDLRFGTGELHTMPGQTGWFKVRNAQVLGPVLDGNDPRFKTDDLYVEIKKRLIGAFQDFEYDEIRADFLRDGPKFVARVSTRGRARTGVRQEFADVTLNFPDLDLALRDAILISRKVFGN
jgi:hypothetical protein